MSSTSGVCVRHTWPPIRRMPAHVGHDGPPPLGPGLKRCVRCLGDGGYLFRLAVNAVSTSPCFSQPNMNSKPTLDAWNPFHSALLGFVTSGVVICIRPTFRLLLGRTLNLAPSTSRKIRRPSLTSDSAPRTWPRTVQGRIPNLWGPVF